MIMSIRNVTIMRFLLVLCITLLAACGSGSGGRDNPSQPGTSNITVAITPKTVTLMQGQTHQFGATVVATTNAAVTWSVANGSGSISANGLYTAPNTPGQYTVTATTLAQPAASDTSTVTVVAPTPTVVIAPKTLTLTQGDTRQFAAHRRQRFNRKVGVGGQRTGRHGDGKLHRVALQCERATGWPHCLGFGFCDETIWCRSTTASATAG